MTFKNIITIKNQSIMPRKKGAGFIVFEGGEGSGKSTQVKLLVKTLRQKGYKVLLTHEPGSKHSKVTKIIRHLILDYKVSKIAELFLYLADRAEHLEKVVKPALRQGKIVICDRFDGSTYAYQYYARGLDWKFVNMANRFVKNGLEPDLYILLDIDPKLGLSRRHSGGKKLTRFDKEDLTFHKKVNSGFRKLAKANHKKWVIVDGSKPVYEIHQEILEVIKKRLNLTSSNFISN